MFYCKNCVSPNTRPRLQFDENGICNACNWHKRKQAEIDWKDRRLLLEDICDRFHKTNGDFDCIVPCSGGKDGSYVAWKMKYELGMNPLCITLRPQMQTAIGRINLENFIQSGFDHILISPNPKTYRKYAKDSLINRGMPKQPFVVGISSALISYAHKFDIKLIVYGEQGEVEYGGSQETETLQKFDYNFLKNIYYEGQDPSEYGQWWKMPSKEMLENLYVTWWSLFEDWDPQHHAKFAKEHMGLEMLVGGSIGTFTNYSQLDDMLQDLHAFLMFCKFGFGRCTSDASIEIRRGRMTREQGVNIVNMIDGQYPVEYHHAYLDYFDMDNDEWRKMLMKNVNLDILKINNDAPLMSNKVWEYERPFILKEKVR